MEVGIAGDTAVNIVDKPILNAVDFLLIRFCISCRSRSCIAFGILPTCNSFILLPGAIIQSDINAARNTAVNSIDKPILNVFDFLLISGSSTVNAVQGSDSRHLLPCAVDVFKRNTAFNCNAAVNTVDKPRTIFFIRFFISCRSRSFIAFGILPTCNSFILLPGAIIQSDINAARNTAVRIVDKPLAVLNVGFSSTVNAVQGSDSRHLLPCAVDVFKRNTGSNCNTAVNSINKPLAVLNVGLGVSFGTDDNVVIVTVGDPLVADVGHINESLIISKNGSSRSSFSSEIKLNTMILSGTDITADIEMRSACQAGKIGILKFEFTEKFPDSNILVGITGSVVNIQCSITASGDIDVTGSIVSHRTICIIDSNTFGIGAAKCQSCLIPADSKIYPLPKFCSCSVTKSKRMILNGGGCRIIGRGVVSERLLNCNTFGN